MNTLIKVLVSHYSPSNIYIEFLKSAIRYDVKFKFMNLFENFLLVYWDLGLFAFLKDCEHICILEDDLSFKLGFVRIA